MKNITTTLAVALGVSLGGNNLAEAQVVPGVERRVGDIIALTVPTDGARAASIAKPGDIAAKIPTDGARASLVPRNGDYKEPSLAPPVSVRVTDMSGNTTKIN